MIFESLPVYSQQFPLNTINFIEKYHINKAYAGISGNRIAYLNVRQQWLDIERAPEYFSGSFFTPVFRLKGGMGIDLHFHSHGAQKNTGLGISYNYMYSTTFGDFSFGFGSSYKNTFFDRQIMLTPEGFYENGNYNPNDIFLENLTGTNISYIKMKYFLLYLYRNFEFGMEFDKGTIGLSDLKNMPVSVGTADLLKINFQYQYNYNETLSIRINGLFYTDLKLYQSDFGVTAIINKKYIAGTNFRGSSGSTIESIGLIAGADITKNIKLIYSYDVGINGLSKVHQDSHQLTGVINLGQAESKKKLPPVIFNPRLY